MAQNLRGGAVGEGLAGLAETLARRSEKLKLKIKLREITTIKTVLNGDDLGRRMVYLRAELGLRNNNGK
jgi:hypothetical protein